MQFSPKKKEQDRAGADPGFSNRGRAKDYLHVAHDHEGEARSPLRQDLGPLKGIELKVHRKKKKKTAQICIYTGPG